MTYIKWLKKQLTRDDPVGDLARDTFADDDHPTTLAEFPDYLRSCGASHACLMAFERSAFEYNKQSKKK